jgi:hypothetical protein
MAIDNNITVTIAEFPTAPTTADSTSFDVRADLFLSRLESLDDELNGFSGELNTIIIEINEEIGAINALKNSAESASDQASNSATLAQNYANKDENVEVETGTYSSKHYSIKASDSATTATTKASEADASATISRKYANEDVDVEVETGFYSAKHFSLKAEAFKDQAQTLLDTINLSPEWVSGTDYAQYAVITDPNDFKTYKSKVAIANSTTAPNEDLTNWALLSTGATTLEALTDTTFTNLQDGQIMKYDLASGKWINTNNVSVTNAPILSTPNATIFESETVAITIDNYSATATYDITLLNGGSYTRNGDTISFTAPLVGASTTDVTYLSVTATEGSNITSSATTVEFNVLNTVIDTTVDEGTDDSALLYVGSSLTNNFTLSNASVSGDVLVATTDSAEATSTVIPQDDGETDYAGLTSNENLDFSMVCNPVDINVAETPTANQLELIKDMSNSDVIVVDSSNELHTVSVGVMVDESIDNTAIHEVFGDGSAVATYNLDGNTNDLGGSYNGTATNVTYGTGKYGQSAVFNGGSYITRDKAFFPIGALSISMWFKTTATAYQILLSTNGLTTNGDGIGVGFIGSGSSDIGVMNNGAWLARVQSALTDWDNGDWHHIVITWTNTTEADGLKIYIDNGAPTTATASGTVTSNDEFYIGRRGGGSYFNGSIDQVRIFNRALTQAEVTALYNEQSTKFTATVTSPAPQAVYAPLPKLQATFNGTYSDAVVDETVYDTGKFTIKYNPLMPTSGRNLQVKVKSWSAGTEIEKIQAIVLKGE